MGASPVSDRILVRSHRGTYSVEFDDQGLERVAATAQENTHVLVDRRVAQLHAGDLAPLLAKKSVLEIEATEAAKSLDRIEGYVEHLVSRKVRRGDVLLAIGGGIVQDITCFIASTLLRGLEWRFFPTTLLAQADSCIGSKSSINVGKAKNLMGTFYPPTHITISMHVLKTLDERDIRSGVGEMLKVHAIDGPATFVQIANDYERLFAEAEAMKHYVRRSLEIKKRFIEEDEFDTGPRNVMNYGHSFGHAIESATDFAIPHGLAVTIGMDMANFVAVQLKPGAMNHYESMHAVLRANCRGFEKVAVPFEPFFSALAKDKKNTGTSLRLILPDAEGCVRVTDCAPDERFRSICLEFLSSRQDERNRASVQPTLER